MPEENKKPNRRKKPLKNPQTPISLPRINHWHPLEPVKIKALDFITQYCILLYLQPLRLEKWFTREIAVKWPVSFSLLHEASKQHISKMIQYVILLPKGRFI